MEVLKILQDPCITPETLVLRRGQWDSWSSWKKKNWEKKKKMSGCGFARISDVNS